MGGRLRLRPGAGALAASLIGLAAPGFTSAQAPARAPDSTALSGVTVVARPELSGLEVNGRRLCRLDPPPGEKPNRPRVVDSYPRPDASPPAGVIYMRVTYSERMSPCGFLLADSFLTAPPQFLEEPALLTRDYRTFYFAVKTEPGKTYATEFNRRFSAPFFKSLYGVGAPPFELKFTTSATAPPSATMAQAMAADPGTPDLAPDPGKLLELWVPREGDDGPDCGSCTGDSLAPRPLDRTGDPKDLNEARGEPEPKAPPP